MVADRAKPSVGGAVLAGLFLLVACDAGRARKVTAEECVRLRDHRAGLLVERSASHLHEDEKAKHRANISAGAGDDFVKSCVEEMTVRVFECQLEARSVEAFERCKRAAGD
jgi:hypothetical protein